MKKRLAIILSILLVILSSIAIYNFVNEDKDGKKSEKNITVTFNDQELNVKDLEDEKLTSFIEDARQGIETEISNSYSPSSIVIEYELVEQGESNYTLEFSGKFSKDGIEVKTSDELEISEYTFNHSDVSEITFTYDTSLNLNFDNYTHFKIGTVNNDTILEEYSIAANPTSHSAVINKKRRLTSDYIPPELVQITVSSQHSGQNNQVRADILPNLETMFSDAKNAGHNLTITSAYRSYSTQEVLFNNYASQYGYEKAATFSAFAGASEHQTGLVVDIGSLNNMSLNFESAFGTTNEGIWLANNAHKYGFILRYPDGKQDITTYMYEPWHFRYVGVELATYLYENNLTLEEFFNIA